MGHSKSLKISIVTGALGFPRILPLSAAGEAARQGRMVASTAAISFIYIFYVGGAVVGSWRSGDRGPGDLLNSGGYGFASRQTTKNDRLPHFTYFTRRDTAGL